MTMARGKGGGAMTYRMMITNRGVCFVRDGGDEAYFPPQPPTLSPHFPTPPQFFKNFLISSPAQGIGVFRKVEEKEMRRVASNGLVKRWREKDEGGDEGGEGRGVKMLQGLYCFLPRKRKDN